MSAHSSSVHEGVTEPQVNALAKLIDNNAFLEHWKPLLRNKKIRKTSESYSIYDNDKNIFLDRPVVKTTAMPTSLYRLFKDTRPSSSAEEHGGRLENGKPMMSFQQHYTPFHVAITYHVQFSHAECLAMLRSIHTVTAHEREDPTLHLPGSTLRS